MRRSLICVMTALLAGTAFAALRLTPQPGSALILRGRSERDWKPAVHLPPGAEYHLMREDPATHGIQALVRFPKRYEAARHTHSGDETILVLKGKLEVEAGDIKRLLRAGDYAVFPAGVAHAVRAVGWRGAEFYTAMSAPYDVTFVAK